jgi:asparagine synthase (glutamine-hydrolysing)
MSGIAGIYNLDGRPVEPALLERMTDVISHRGPDGVGHWIDGPVGLGHQMLCTTPESLRESQPWLDETEKVCLTFDGRIDNRKDLAKSLKAKGALLRDDTDAELVLKAYECWGLQSPKHLVGDFAFVLWDGLNRQLFCARDFLGLKPLYYIHTGRAFLFGSELKQLFEDETTRREPNEGMIGEYLASAITDKEETLFKNILRLPPGHYLLVRPGQFHKQCYWSIPTQEVRYRRDKDYAEHFLESFKEAVHCRLRSHTPVGVSLSGGVDSSSVMVVAQALRNEGRVSSTKCEAFSLVFPALPCDESLYIQDVMGFCGASGHQLLQPPVDIGFYSRQASAYCDFPGYPNGCMASPIRHLLQEKGYSVLLDGVGADEWLTGSSYHYAELLRSFRLSDLLREYRLDTRMAGMRRASSRLMRHGIWPLIPETPRRMIAGLFATHAPGHSWINEDFALHTKLRERIDNSDSRQLFSSTAQKDVYESATNGYQLQAFEIEERDAALSGYEQRQPFNDQRLVEFALALPERQRHRGEQSKYVLRKAMLGLLPDVVRERETKSHFSHLFAQALLALGEKQLFDSLSIGAAGWVNAEQVKQMYLRMKRLFEKGDEEYMSQIWPLWMISGVEVWFNSVILDRPDFSDLRLEQQNVNISVG